jgi:hypothetical protein
MNQYLSQALMRDYCKMENYYYTLGESFHIEEHFNTSNIRGTINRGRSEDFAVSCQSKIFQVA